MMLDKNYMTHWNNYNKLEEQHEQGIAAADSYERRRELNSFFEQALFIHPETGDIMSSREAYERLLSNQGDVLVRDLESSEVRVLTTKPDGYGSPRPYLQSAPLIPEKYPTAYAERYVAKPTEPEIVADMRLLGELYTAEQKMGGKEDFDCNHFRQGLIEKIKANAQILESHHLAENDESVIAYELIGDNYENRLYNRDPERAMFLKDPNSDLCYRLIPDEHSHFFKIHEPINLAETRHHSLDWLSANCTPAFLENWEKYEAANRAIQEKGASSAAEDRNIAIREFFRNARFCDPETMKPITGDDAYHHALMKKPLIVFNRAMDRENFHVFGLGADNSTFTLSEPKPIHEIRKDFGYPDATYIKLWESYEEAAHLFRIGSVSSPSMCQRQLAAFFRFAQFRDPETKQPISADEAKTLITVKKPVLVQDPITAQYRAFEAKRDEHGSVYLTLSEPLKGGLLPKPEPVVKVAPAVEQPKPAPIVEETVVEDSAVEDSAAHLFEEAGIHIDWFDNAPAVEDPVVEQPAAEPTAKHPDVKEHAREEHDHETNEIVQPIYEEPAPDMTVLTAESIRSRLAEINEIRESIRKTESLHGKSEQYKQMREAMDAVLNTDASHEMSDDELMTYRMKLDNLYAATGAYQARKNAQNDLNSTSRTRLEAANRLAYMLSDQISDLRDAANYRAEQNSKQQVDELHREQIEETLVRLMIEKANQAQPTVEHEAQVRNTILGSAALQRMLTSRPDALNRYAEMAIEEPEKLLSAYVRFHGELQAANQAHNPAQNANNASLDARRNDEQVWNNQNPALH